MATKIELIVDNQDDIAAFNEALPGLLEKAHALPGLQRLESGRVWPKEDGSATPAARTLTLWFAGYDEASAAASSSEGGDFFGSFITAASGKVTGLFTDIEAG